MIYITCPRCEQTLPETCFFVSRTRKNGRRGHCKVCEAEAILEWKVRTGRVKNPRSQQYAPDLDP